MQNISFLARRFYFHIRCNGFSYAFRRAVSYIMARSKFLPQEEIPRNWTDPFAEAFSYRPADGDCLNAAAGQKTIAVAVARDGNFFMTEIAYLVSAGLRELGYNVVLADEITLPSSSDMDVLIIVAPHEFFTIRNLRWPIASLNKTPVVMLNTEQPQTQWFAVAANYLRNATQIWDINYRTAVLLRANRFPAFFLPLGYTEDYSSRFSPEQPIARSLPLASLPRSMIEACPERYSDRPIDFIFVGTNSPRRDNFFAINAKFFSNFRCFFYMPDGNEPFLVGAEKTITFDQLHGLTRRSKIMLNIHRDDKTYFEWQRIVNIGIANGAAVVSDTCDGNPVVHSGQHYIEAPLENVTDMCSQLIGNVELASRFAAHAQVSYQERIKIAPYLSALMNTLNSER